MTEQEDTIDVFAELVEIDEKLAANKNLANELSTRRAVIEKQVLDIMANTGISKITVNGRTVFQRPSFYAKQLVPKDQVANALIEAGFQSMVKNDFNSNSLNAMVAEWIKAGDGIPEALQGVIDSVTITRVQSRKV